MSVRKRQRDYNWPETNASAATAEASDAEQIAIPETPIDDGQQPVSDLAWNHPTPAAASTAAAAASVPRKSLCWPLKLSSDGSVLVGDVVRRWIIMGEHVDDVVASLPIIHVCMPRRASANALVLGIGDVLDRAPIASTACWVLKPREGGCYHIYTDLDYVPANVDINLLTYTNNVIGVNTIFKHSLTTDYSTPAYLVRDLIRKILEKGEPRLVIDISALTVAGITSVIHVIDQLDDNGYKTQRVRDDIHKVVGWIHASTSSKYKSNR